MVADADGTDYVSDMVPAENGLDYVEWSLYCWSVTDSLALVDLYVID